ncbi:MAG: GNAT family N-acetyltransferase [Flavobacteriales bacterium]
MALPSDLLLNGPTRLRALEPTDIDQVLDWENEPEHWSVTGTSAPYSRAALDALCRGHQDLYTAGQLRWIIEDDGEVVGAVDLYDFHARDLRAGIGILVSPDARDRGIARRALEIALRHAELALLLRSVHAEVHADHAGSLALFDGAGFERVGRYADWTRTSDGWKDLILFQRLLSTSP